MSAGPQMRVVCAWCKAELGTKPCRPAQAWLVSHGLCPECFEEQKAALQFLDTVKPPAPSAVLREVTPEHFAPSTVRFSCRPGVGGNRT